MGIFQGFGNIYFKKHQFVVFLLALGCIFSFSSSWIVIRYQVMSAGFLWPLSLRFLLGAMFLLLFGVFSRTRFSLPVSMHKTLLGYSLLMFSLNFIAIYAASRFLYSGINSLVCASVSVFNVIASHFILKKSLKKSLIASAAIGFFGLSIIVFFDGANSKIADGSSYDTIKGVLLGLFGAIITSCGQVFSYKIHQTKISPIVTTTYGMFYGSIITALIALTTNGLPSLELSTLQIFSLLYIASVPTALGFLLYFNLMKKIGPEKSGYIFLVTPVLSLVISKYFEGYNWNIYSYLGMVFIFVGHLMMNSPNVFKKIVLVKKLAIKKGF